MVASALTPTTAASTPTTTINIPTVVEPAKVKDVSAPATAASTVTTVAPPPVVTTAVAAATVTFIEKESATTTDAAQKTAYEHWCARILASAGISDKAMERFAALAKKNPDNDTIRSEYEQAFQASK